jgi:pre-60S factor REI1
VTCFTAPEVTFNDRESLQDHYKSDWHRYNLKRKVAGLPPLPKDQFEARKAAALAAKNDQETKASSHKLDHVKEKKKEKVAVRVAGKKQRAKEMAEKEKLKPPKPPTLLQEYMKNNETNHDENKMNDNDDENSKSEEEEEEEDFEVDLCRSIFDSNLAEDVDESLSYMAKKYGFFIPDVEYVSDLNGLVEYLHEKVGLGHTCLYCNKVYRSANSCRQHMVDSSHCKIRYDEQEDMDEISDFYDFSAANASILPDSKTVSNSKAAADDDDDEELNSDEDIEDELNGRKSGIEVLPSGELVVTRLDGTRKTIGVRWLKKYYDQNARAIDERASVVAAQKERLTNIYRQMGVATGSVLMNQLVAAGDVNNTTGTALMKAYNRDTRYTHGAELQAARQHFKREQLKQMKLGMSENWNIKNRFRATRIRAEGIGVHG